MASASGSGEPVLEDVEAPAPDGGTVDVHGLEFRKVGIQSWKVVKIGLVYDFSDYKTLAKYIVDGRVTGRTSCRMMDRPGRPSGTLPIWSNASWTSIWRAAAQQSRSRKVGARAEDDEPTNIVGMEGLADSLGDDLAAAAAPDAAARQLAGGSLGSAIDEALRTGGGDANAAPRFVDPFEARKQARSSASQTGRSPAPAPRPRTPAAPSTEAGGGRGSSRV